MEALLLSIHVLAGIIFVGPVAVVTSLYPRFVGKAPVARVLHRVTRVYGALALVVPTAGLALGFVQGRMGEVWLIIAMVLTAFAGGLLALQIVPLQRDLLDGGGDGALVRMRVLVGVFNLLWAVVVVLMIVRPGSDYV